MTGRKGVSGPFSSLEGFAWELMLLLGLSSARLHKHHLWNRYKRQCTVGTPGEPGSREGLILALELRKVFFCSGERARSEETVSVCAGCGVCSTG